MKLVSARTPTHPKAPETLLLKTHTPNPNSELPTCSECSVRHVRRLKVRVDTASRDSTCAGGLGRTTAAGSPSCYQACLSKPQKGNHFGKCSHSGSVFLALTYVRIWGLLATQGLRPKGVQGYSTFGHSPHNLISGFRLLGLWLLLGNLSEVIRTRVSSTSYGFCFRCNRSSSSKGRPDVSVVEASCRVP